MNWLDINKKKSTRFVSILYLYINIHNHCVCNQNSTQEQINTMFCHEILWKLLIAALIDSVSMQTLSRLT